MYAQPPTPLIVAVLLAFALPASSVIGLAAVWAWRRFIEPHI